MNAVTQRTEAGAHPALARAWERARARWPRVQLELVTYADFVLARAQGDLERRALEDLYLACACVGRDEHALAVLDADILSNVAEFVATVSREVVFADEIRLELTTRLVLGHDGGAPKLLAYTGRGALAGFVKVAALRLAQTRRRCARTTEPLTGEEALVGANAELLLTRRVQADAFRSALRAALGALEPIGRAVLKARFLDGLSLEEVAAAHRISRATAARRIVAARAAVVASMTHLLRDRYGTEAPAPAALLADVHSELSLRLGDYFEKG
ncbi:MAG: hypothetical protein KIT84_42715 [Labilithrix sp.]|nr:hypothetical protein [Labilithrix sp.]MCW5817791.1 hypothetical protein [Labilithrix sp.]